MKAPTGANESSKVDAAHHHLCRSVKNFVNVYVVILLAVELGMSFLDFYERTSRVPANETVIKIALVFANVYGVIFAVASRFVVAPSSYKLIIIFAAYMFVISGVSFFAPVCSMRLSLSLGSLSMALAGTTAAITIHTITQRANKLRDQIGSRL